MGWESPQPQPIPECAKQFDWVNQAWPQCTDITHLSVCLVRNSWPAQARTFWRNPALVRRLQGPCQSPPSPCILVLLSFFWPKKAGNGGHAVLACFDTTQHTWTLCDPNGTTPLDHDCQRTRIRYRLYHTERLLADSLIPGYRFVPCRRDRSSPLLPLQATY